MRIKLNWLYTTAFVLITVIGTIQATAQWKAGVYAGETFNSLTTSIGFAKGRHYDSLNGFTIGVPVQYSIFDWLAVQADVSYTQKNYKMTRDKCPIEYGDEEFVYNKTYCNYTNGFLQLPIYAHLSIGNKKVRGFVNGGFYAGYWINSHIKGLSPIMSMEDEESPDKLVSSFDESYSFDSRRDNRFDGGAMVGAGVEYQLTHKFQLFAEGRYYYAFTDLQKNYMTNQIHRYNNTFAVQIGCMYTFGK